MPRTSTWDVRRLPGQDGKTFVVTGGTSGIGYFIAEQLTAAGAHVILAARSEGKARRPTGTSRCTARTISATSLSAP